MLVCHLSRALCFTGHEHLLVLKRDRLKIKRFRLIAAARFSFSHFKWKKLEIRPCKKGKTNWKAHGYRTKPTSVLLSSLELNVSLFFSPSLYNGVYGGGLELSPSAESSGSEAPPSSPDRLRLSGVFSSPPSRSPREPVGKRRGLINNWMCPSSLIYNICLNMLVGLK